MADLEEEKDGLAALRAYEARRAALVRPRIPVIGTIVNIAAPLLVAAAVFCSLFFSLSRHRLGISLAVSLGSLALYILWRLRDVAVFAILLYRRFAPADVRLRCLFTPSCSEYAEQALLKYGFWRALPIIVRRLKRCHEPNGGYDPVP